VETGTRTFQSSSIGRLFDAAAAVLGFTRSVSFEGQAAIWLEHQARTAACSDEYPFPFVDHELDFRPLLQGLMEDRMRGRDVREIARAFHWGVARGVSDAALVLLSENTEIDTIVLSGGVFQNDLLLQDLKSLLDKQSLRIWTNRTVPANDGGISLGQAALAAFQQSGQEHA
jgi:hydrogenase maturation protein HypF